MANPDMIVDIANYLHTKAIGVFDPVGTTGNIFVEFAPAAVLKKLCLYQLAGTAREYRYRGDVRYPILHVEYSDDTRQKVKDKFASIITLLEQQYVDSTLCRYFFKVQSEPAPWKVSDSEYKGAVNFFVRQVVK